MTEAALEAPAAKGRGAWRWLLSLALLAGVAWQLAKAGGDLAAHPVTLAWGPLWLSCVGLVAFLGLGCELWRRLLAGLGYRLDYRTAFYILFYSNVAKYLPGGVWNMVGRVVLAERAGVPRLASSVSVLMETACQVVAALVIALGAFGPALLPNVGALAGLLVAVVVGMHPRILNAWLALGERLTRRELPRLPFSYGVVLLLLVGYVLNWLLLGVSFAALGQALSPGPLDAARLGRLTGSFAVAWNAGVFAFFFPAGLGVREAALTWLLAGAFPPGWPAALALVARVWFTLGEVVAFGLALLARKPAA